ncbi:MAG: DUF2141 domain-containing protein [Robiginitomaculum sp.]
MSILAATAVLSLGVLSLGAMPANATDLEVTVKGEVKSGDVIHYGIFNRSAGFTDPRKTLAEEAIKVKGNSAVAVFKGLEPGEYAVATYNDKNGNGKLDKSWIGRPKEPYGFSNNAKGSFGPPSFAKAMIKVGEENKSISIKITK